MNGSPWSSAMNLPNNIAVTAAEDVYVSEGNSLKVGTLNSLLFDQIDLAAAQGINIQDLILNDQECFLALVGTSSLAVADLSSVHKSASNTSVSIYKVGSFKDRIVSALWHPASATKTHLVVLTQTSVQIFDLALSCVDAQLKIDLTEYPKFGGDSAVSMAFGSHSSYLGSITLYISTGKGSVHALTPFIYEGFPQAFTGLMIHDLLKEREDLKDLTNANIPPASIFNDFRNAFLDQEVFAADLDNLYQSLHISDFPDEKEWNFKAAGIKSPRLVGPLTQVDPRSRIINASPKHRFTILASLSEQTNGGVRVSYLAQLSPLIYAFNDLAEIGPEPKKPEPKKREEPKDKYVKPRRGFGFVVVPGGDKATDDGLSKEEEHYKKSLEDYKAKLKVASFIKTTFNVLTIISKDNVSLGDKAVENIKFAANESWLVLAGDNKIVAGDVSKAADQLLDPSCEAFTVKYYLKSKTSGSGFCFYTSNEELLSICSWQNASKPQVVNVVGEKTSTTDPQLAVSYELETRSRTPGLKAALPARELRLFLEGAGNLPAISKIDENSSKSLEEIHNVSSLTVQRLQKLTGFILTLQSVLAIQHGELHLQRQGLSEIAAKNFSSQHEVTQNRIQALLERQSKLADKAKRIQDLLLERFEESKKKFQLPLSNSERAWFKELNSITKKITVGDEDCLGLQLIVSDLTQKVEAIESVPETAEEKLAKTLSDLLMDKNWKRLNFILKHEGNEIDNGKEKIEELLSRVSSLNLGVPV
ncbi:hypothetical protein PUMCH_000075 [Australozyma saopauloensis]|uniref:Nucleoporin Nup159/Nup146 N-terminal domain-containing protein n=1 Tax=Australozyma saopauloensis TaxID=291208 RepID=A0AAX4H2U8_9ASCO|nr:hypothetical protein PUMCH_000075 [[Candida] saopauloensis]